MNALWRGSPAVLCGGRLTRAPIPLSHMPVLVPARRASVTSKRVGLAPCGGKCNYNNTRLRRRSGNRGVCASSRIPGKSNYRHRLTAAVRRYIYTVYGDQETCSSCPRRIAEKNHLKRFASEKRNPQKQRLFIQIIDKYYSNSTTLRFILHVVGFKNVIIRAFCFFGAVQI